MKALWVASWYPNKHSPYNGDFIQRMARAVSPFCSLAVLSVTEGKVKAVEVELGAEGFLQVLVYIPSSQPGKRLPLKGRAIRAMNYLKGYIKGIKTVHRHFGKPDVLHLNVIFPAGLFVLFYHFFNKTPFLITEHWSGFSKANQNLLKWYHLWVARLCTKSAKMVLPVSEMLAQDMKSLKLKGDYQIIPNVVDTELFTPINGRMRAGKFRFLHISHLLDKVKNVSGILNCVRELAKERNDFRMDIIGSGPDEERLFWMARNYGIDQITNFLGEVEHEMISQEMQSADCVIMFSNYETFSCVILEALCTGVPVIGTETMGVRDWISPGKGYLVRPGNEDQLITAMKTIMDKRDEFDPEYIRSEVAEKCSYPAVGSKIVAYYHQILG